VNLPITLVYVETRQTSIYPAMLFTRGDWIHE